MARKAPARVSWIYSEEDAPIARELLDLAAVLEDQGLVRSWSLALLGAQGSYQVPSSGDLETIVRSDVVMWLAGRMSLSRFTLETLALRTRLVQVLVRPPGTGSFASANVQLPRDGEPLLARRDRREGLLDVIRGLQEIVAFRPTEAPAALVRGAPTDQASGLSINEIFRLDGPPSVTFVEPPLFSELKLALRTMGTGLVVEGPSKVGKTTAIRKAMESLRVPERDQIWWDGREPPSLDEVRRTLRDLRDGDRDRDRWLFIDDFHYVEDEGYRRRLAFGMKALADQARPRGKVTLIGINPLGSSLVDVMPDLSGRFRIYRLDVEKDWKGSTQIAEVIILGERAANIRFRRRDEFVVAAGGSFFLAQYLCNVAAVKSGIHAAQPDTVAIDLGPAEAVAAIQGELAARFRAPLLELAAFDAAPPPRGAGLSLLWLLARSTDGFVTLQEARLRFPMLGAAFEWFLESNLTRCFQEHPRLRGLLYFNRATTTLTLEDPQLKFYLRELDWEQLAEASGHGRVSFHPEDGPLWPATVKAVGHASGRTSAVGTGASVVARRVLHLSDLHFATQDQATVSYAQLAADLRQLGITDRLDALIVSGDLVNRADPAEYDAARLFLEHLMTGFGLSPRQITLVPGNHDVSWPLAEAAYSLRRRSDLRGASGPGTFIEHGKDVIEVRDEDAYRQRFEPFSNLYQLIKGAPYPLDHAEQFTFEDPPDSGLLILGLNSAWEIDHHFRDRASIHPEALARALLKLGPPSAAQLRVAVFHHPLHSGEDSRIRDAAFLQQLAVAGFRIVLHGHVHKADAELYRYERAAGGRQIEIVAAGTFGAATHEWVPGYPLQYNLLLVAPDKITVETRCRHEPNGAWEADARWRQAPSQDPLPRYFIER